MRWQFFLATSIALVVALLIAYSTLLVHQNGKARAEVSQRALFVQQTVPLEGLYREVVKALADLSVRNQDRSLTELLARNGITLNVSANPVQPSTTTLADARRTTKP